MTASCIMCCLKQILHVACHKHQKWYYLELLSRFTSELSAKMHGMPFMRALERKKKFTQLALLLLCVLLCDYCYYEQNKRFDKIKRATVEPLKVSKTVKDLISSVFSFIIKSHRCLTKNTHTRVKAYMPSCTNSLI